MRGIYKIVVACGNSPGKNVVKTSYVFTNDSRRARAKDVPEPRLSLFKQKKRKREEEHASLHNKTLYFRRLSLTWVVLLVMCHCCCLVLFTA